MKVTVKLYSLLAELAGNRSIDIEVNDNTTVSDVLNLLSDINEGFNKAVEMIGKEGILVLDGSGRRLEWSDKVDGVIHVMPPPEGGERRIRTGILAKGESINLNELIMEAARSSTSTGAIAVFVGSVRADNFGKNVEKLIYEDAGKLTRKKLHEIAEEIATNHDLPYVAAYHYVGDLKPGDLTMIVVVAARGRSEAFPAMEELVESMKRKLPIWKKEVYTDGSYSYILGGKPYIVKS